MMNYLKTTGILLVMTILASALTMPKNACPDLVVKEIQHPEFDPNIEGSVIKVTIANKGKISSRPTRAKLFDVDLSYKEGIAMGYDTVVLQLIAENNARGAYYANSSTNGDQNVDSLDYDLYVEDIVEVPQLQPGEEITLTFIIENYWVYDSNCEIEVEVDFEDMVNECDEENNTLRFFGWG